MKLTAAISLATRICIESALEQSGGNVKEAAQIIGVHRTHLYDLAAKHGVSMARRRRSILVVPELAQWKRA
jgi:DNA-binding NtrC family response regulator